MGAKLIRLLTFLRRVPLIVRCHSSRRLFRWNGIGALLSGGTLVAKLSRLLLIIRVRFRHRRSGGNG